MTAFRNQTYFFFILNIEKKLKSYSKISLTTNPNMFFSWVLLNSQTINPMTNPPPTTCPPTHQPRTHRPTESIIIFERLDIRYILISQNTTGKTRKYISVYYSKSPLFFITNIRRSQLYLLF